MRKVIFTMMCLAAMLAAGTGLKAQEVTITLSPGWTWISYLGTEPKDFATALGSFTPEVGDVIKSKWGTATYRSSGRWVGTISRFDPGYGYHYKSQRTVPVTVTLNAQPPLQVAVTTATPTDITAYSMACGGEVTDTGNSQIIVRGVCWSNAMNPAIADPHTTDGYDTGSFSSLVEGLEMNSTYYVRAYVVTASGAVYGEQKMFSTKDGVPVLTTSAASEIGITWATCGGDISDDGGIEVTEHGICWSTDHNPTIEGDHGANGAGLGSFTVNMHGLEPNTTYYVRAYATNSHTTAYGNELNFTTMSSGTHMYVDLGLPSGTLWAICNVGADAPEEYGYYFAWGETQPKDTYNWSTYQYCMGSNTTFTKYCNNSNYGYNGFTDNLTTLLPEDDAATANWGSGWRMPTKEEWQELYNNTTVIWTTQNGVNGRLFTASNGNTLFLPAAGFRSDSSLDNAGSDGYYWSSSLFTGYPYYAWGFNFHSDNCGMGHYSRRCGFTVRPVCSSRQN